ncbi:MAG: DNA polymerase III subunit delta [Acetilactobacillus jinshanensis]
MSYRALYRVWRPQRFDELIGQHVITQTFKNAIITGQISHAYLFAGPRGTGKTSAAKILAKAVNCPNQKDGEPCNHCKICKAITAGKLNDVIEIDAASNNGVDEIRNVRDKAKYAPTQAKYKVYIIDEVHMLSTGAFNALLKTLEEPPAHVIFIMATTEPQKIPATIISRTQRFNFRRIQPQDILARMEYILKHEKVTYDDKALKVIARAAEGGMRDALSILDEVMSYGKDHVTYKDALRVTGSVTNDLMDRYLKEVMDHDVSHALADVQKILDSGKDANQFVNELINYCQDLLLYQQSPQMILKKELGIVDDNFKRLAKQISPDLIYRIVGRVDDVEERMRFTVHPDVYLEILTVRIATLRNDLARQVNQLMLIWLRFTRS